MKYAGSWNLTDLSSEMETWSGVDLHSGIAVNSGYSSPLMSLAAVCNNIRTGTFQHVQRVCVTAGRGGKKLVHWTASYKQMTKKGQFWWTVMRRIRSKRGGDDDDQMWTGVNPPSVSYLATWQHGIVPNWWLAMPITYLDMPQRCSFPPRASAPASEDQSSSVSPGVTGVCGSVLGGELWAPCHDLRRRTHRKLAGDFLLTVASSWAGAGETIRWETSSVFKSRR